MSHVSVKLSSQKQDAGGIRSVGCQSLALGHHFSCLSDCFGDWDSQASTLLDLWREADPVTIIMQFQF